MTSYQADLWQDGEWRTSSLSVEDLSELLRQGVARLKEDQTDAPLELLDLLESRVENVDVFGPSVTEPKILKKVSDQLFQDGVRQYLLDGHTVEWVTGFDHLMDKAEMLASACEVQPANLFQQFRSVMLARLRTVTGTVQTTTKMSIEDREKRGLVPDLQENSMLATNPITFKKVGRDWAQFYQRLVSLRDRSLASVEQALLEGRILCSEETARGDRLFPPNLAGTLDQHVGRGGIHYLFTHGLPSSLLHDLDDLPRLRGEAKAWIEKVGKALAANGKRATKAQLLKAARKRFHLTMHAVKELWPDVDFPGKSQSGAIRDDQKVSLSEIMEIE